MRNIAAILGPSPLFWCWPSQPVPGDGLRFEIAQGSGEWVEFSKEKRRASDEEAAATRGPAMGHRRSGLSSGSGSGSGDGDWRRKSTGWVERNVADMA